MDVLVNREGHLMENTIPHSSLVIRVGTRTLETTHTSTSAEQGDSSNSNVENDSYNNNTVAPPSRKRFHGSNDSYDRVFAKKMKPDDVENDMALVKCVVKSELVDCFMLESSKKCNRNANNSNVHKLADTSVEVIDLTSELDKSWLPLDEQIQQFFLLNAEPERVTQQKVAAVKQLANYVKEYNRKAKVYMFGSTLSKIAKKKASEGCIVIKS
ncbi:Phosphatidylethanolamine N-methyltransferase [Trichinella spiralis]|uniref:Phosphatidylethanolamine N-methyltransferase n=1 Tax=Trichinella spiralis TaxID=6334 RepID=A0ABR3KG86_TRISP